MENDNFISDRELTKRFVKGVEIEKIKKLLKNKPIAKYDLEKRQAYLEYSNGDRKYYA